MTAKVKYYNNSKCDFSHSFHSTVGPTHNIDLVKKGYWVKIPKSNLIFSGLGSFAGLLLRKVLEMFNFYLLKVQTRSAQNLK